MRNIWYNLWNLSCHLLWIEKFNWWLRILSRNSDISSDFRCIICSFGWILIMLCSYAKMAAFKLLIYIGLGRYFLIDNSINFLFYGMKFRMLKRDNFKFLIKRLIWIDVSILLMIRGVITLLIIDISLKLCFFLLYKFK